MTPLPQSEPDELEDLLVDHNNRLANVLQSFDRGDGRVLMADVAAAKARGEEEMDRTKAAIQAHVDKQVAAARIDELEMAVYMAGKTMLNDGGLIETAHLEGGDRDKVSANILKTRLAALKQSNPKQEPKQ